MPVTGLTEGLKFRLGHPKRTGLLPKKPEETMKTLSLTRRGITLTALALIASAGVALAAYTYKCPKCGFIQTYEFPASPRCPNDGYIMMPN
jgi:hypothetical protein